VIKISLKMYFNTGLPYPGWVSHNCEVILYPHPVCPALPSAGRGGAGDGGRYLITWPEGGRWTSHKSISRSRKIMLKLHRNGMRPKKFPSQPRKRLFDQLGKEALRSRINFFHPVYDKYSSSRCHFG
jgi:hypothetical protein